MRVAAMSLCILATAFFEPHRLSSPATQEVELRSADFAAAHDVDLVDLRRMQRELALHALVGHHAADGEHLAAARAAAGDYDACENLNAFLVPFQNFRVHIDRVADGELGDHSLKRWLFDEFENLLAHVFILLYI